MADKDVRPTRFAIVGSGWRAHFMLRIAQMSSGRLVPTAVVVRSDAKEQELTRWGVPAVRSIEEAVQSKPDFVVVAVDWPGMPGVTKTLVDLGIPVLSETPPAPDLVGLRDLWKAVGDSGLVQVAEQYMLMPGHAARLAAVQRGIIGDVTSVEVASTHMYHAVSMIRGFLGDRFGCPNVIGHRSSAPLVDPVAFDGWREHPQPEDRSVTLGILDFPNGVGIYNFVENQWWNPLRARRLVIRGTLGEIVDDIVTRWDGADVVTSPLSYRRTGIDMNLEGNELQHISLDGDVLWRNGWFGGRMSEDDLAVAEILQRMGEHVHGDGPPPYPLADACQDHAIALAIELAADQGTPVRLNQEDWAQAPASND